MKQIAAIVLIFNLFSCQSEKNVEQQSTDVQEKFSRTEWFEQARLGMFIHWSAGAVEGARFQGEKLRNPLPYGEWLRCRNRVPREEYDKLIAQMTITQKKVDKWAEMASKAGMKYLMFVAKHHDGLAYWPSDVSDYTFDQLTGLDVDVCDMVAKACKKYGLKLGFYYSQWQDWEHPYGFGNFWDYEKDASLLPTGNEWLAKCNNGVLFRPTLTKDQYMQYWNEKSLPQVRELIQRYDPAIFWFDMYAPREYTNMTEAECRTLLDLVRKESPACMVNTRLGIKEVGGNGVDYRTLGDNELGKELLTYPWESSVTLNHSWGYNRDDKDYKTPRFFIESLVSNIALGGNLQINIGPKADGSITREVDVVFSEIGECISQNAGLGFYNNTYAGVIESMQDWGTITKPRDMKNTLYLHVQEWPIDGILRLNGIINKVSVRNLQNSALCPVEDFGYVKRINIGKIQQVPYNQVFELKFDGELTCQDDWVGEINNGGHYLSVHNAKVIPSAIQPSTQGGWIPDHIECNNNDELIWEVYVCEAGKKDISICYSSTLKDNLASVSLTLDKKVVSITRLAQTHSDNWEYRTVKLGTIEVSEPGKHIIKIKAQAKEELNLHLAHMFLKSTIIK